MVDGAGTLVHSPRTDVSCGLALMMAIAKAACARDGVSGSVNDIACVFL
jgi:hypothetical protein